MNKYIVDSNNENLIKKTKKRRKFSSFLSDLKKY